MSLSACSYQSPSSSAPAHSCCFQWQSLLQSLPAVRCPHSRRIDVTIARSSWHCCSVSGGPPPLRSHPTLADQLMAWPRLPPRLPLSPPPLGKMPTPTPTFVCASLLSSSSSSLSLSLSSSSHQRSPSRCHSQGCHLDIRCPCLATIPHDWTHHPPLLHRNSLLAVALC